MKVVILSDEHSIPLQYNDRVLRGNKKGYRLLHINGRSSNWVLLYQMYEDKVVFIRTGNHDEVLR